MSRISTSLSGIERALLNRLAEANAAAALSSLRLATGQRILRPAHEPSTFLHLSGLRSQLAGATAAMGNVTAASSMISQAQTSLGLVRSQLEAIRTELVADEDRGLSASQRADAQADIDDAIDRINELAGASIDGRRLLDGSADFLVTGRLSSQVADLWVHATRDGSSPTISGTVLQTATQAELTYTGTAGTVTDDATFTLTGRRGSASLSVSDGDDLDDVAQQINDRSHETGVVASVDGNELTLQSVDYGSSAEVTVDVSSGAFVVFGGDGTGTDYGTDAVATINGKTYAGQTDPMPAELRHRETTGTFASDAQIRITGPLGSYDVTIDAGDTLADVAADIAAQSGTTGVTASVDGSDLLIQTTSTGSSETIHVDVTSGDFDTLTGYTPPQPATLTHHTAGGTIAGSTVIEVTGSSGSRNVSLGAGDTLQEAADAINTRTPQTGVQAVVSGNDLLIQSVDTGPSAFATVRVISGTFDFDGGDATGTAYGADGESSATGVDGSDGIAQVDGNRFWINENGFRYEIEFAAGFEGDFNPMTVSGEALTFALSPDVRHRSTLSIPSVSAWQLGGISGRLDQLYSGGGLDGLDGNTSQALRVVDEALAQLTQIEAAVDGFAAAAVSTSSDYLTDLSENLTDAIDQTDGFNETEESVLLAHYQMLAANAYAGLSIIQQQRAAAVNLLQQIAGLA